MPRLSQTRRFLHSPRQAQSALIGALWLAEHHKHTLPLTP